MRFRGRIVAAVVAVTVALSGCAAGLPGQAAIVGNSSIPVSVVESSFDAFMQVSVDPATPEKEVSQFRKGMRAKMLGTFMMANASVQVAQSQGVSVTQDEVAAVIMKDPAASELSKKPELVPYVDAWATYQALAHKAQNPDAFTQAALAVPMQVNPRYGHWNLTSQLTEFSLSGSLSVPAQLLERQP